MCALLNMPASISREYTYSTNQGKFHALLVSKLVIAMVSTVTSASSSA